MKSRKYTSRAHKRKKGAFIVELLVTIAIGGMVLANSSVRLGAVLTQSRWAEANILRENLQNTYDKWVSLGGTHASSPLDPSNYPSRVISDLEFGDQFFFTVTDIRPFDQARVQVTFNFSVTLGTRAPSERRFYFIAPSDAIRTDGFITGNSNTGADGSTRTTLRTLALNKGLRYSMKTFNFSASAVTATTFLFEVPQVEENLGAELTMALWNTFLSGSAPQSSGGITQVTDSTRSGVNSTAIRLAGSFPTPPVMNGNESILLEDRFRISFQPTSNNRGIWTVNVQ